MQEGKTRQYLDMMNQWLILKQEHKSLDCYLKQKGYGTIAIYGLGVYGRHLIRDLFRTEVTVVYGIDQKKSQPYRGIPVVQPSIGLQSVDVIINTVIHEHEMIRSYLAGIVDIPVLNLEDVIYESYG